MKFLLVYSPCALRTSSEFSPSLPLRLQCVSERDGQMLLQRWRHATEAPPDVPAGHVAVVCVGATSRRRFVVRASHLNHPAFRQLLRRAEEEEYGSPSSGGRPGPLALPCDEALFQRLMILISSSSSSSSRSQNYCSIEGFEAVLSSPGGSSFAGDSLPLLRDSSSIAH